MKHLPLIVAAFAANTAIAQSPEIEAWIVNSMIETGYDGIETNVQQIDYSNANVYIACTCIPGYDIGPWSGNPNEPANQNFVFRITRAPVENIGTKIATPLGHIGVWTNGVSMFNPKDAASYNNQDVWHQDAIVVEGSSFDECLGHPAPNGEYHTHLNPTCLYDDDNSTIHSPIIGYAFDGFPVYGAFGYLNPNGTGGIVRMTSSYQLRNIAARTTLANGSSVSPGPAVSTSYPLGYYIEDYEYVAMSGTLDQFNGRFCVTPEYPNGTYAYFVAIDENGEGVYPYVLGPEYYGTVQPGNTGPASGHNTISETVTNYATADVVALEELQLDLYPNPATETLFVSSADDVMISNYHIVSADGVVLVQGTKIDNGIDVSVIAKGTYFLVLDISGVDYALTFVK